MEEALEYESGAGNRPLEGSGDEGVGTGRGLEGADVCCCADIAVRRLLKVDESGLKQPRCNQEVLLLGAVIIRNGHAWISPRRMNHEAMVVGVTCSRQGTKAAVRYDEEAEEGESKKQGKRVTSDVKGKRG